MDFSVNAEEKELLLRVARASILTALENEVEAEAALARDSERRDGALGERCGAFVSLHLGRALRGCIGRMASDDALVSTVRRMAREAAFEDPRFPPLSREELDRATLEISALSPMAPCPDPEAVAVGVHGVYLSRAGRSGVFLPQVPGEQGWDRTRYLDALCAKAGLPPRSYLAPDARLWTFTAVVFSEQGR